VAVRFDRNTNAHASSGAASAAGAGSTNSLPLRVQYSSAPPSGANRFILGEIGFGPQAVLSHSALHPRAVIGLQPLDGVPCRELWTSDVPVEYGQRGGVQYAMNEEYLFGLANETMDVASVSFEERVKAMYDAIFSLTESEGRPNLLRMWNYFPSMNAESQGLENYQRFCRARSLAFQDHYREFIDRLPSASAIGTVGGAVAVYFIAARSAGVHRENPRQLSAYSYPRQYGPRSPSFARGTLKRVGSGETFFISGTASIVGHQSLHPGDVRAQAEEALRNIETLIDSTRRDETTRFHGMQDLDNLKVYVRRPADLPLVREVVAAHVDPDAHILYLQGDVCRRELLVEIEATLYVG
jgi:chorismate lyase / 3-hydroxybenzoate synthase